MDLSREFMLNLKRNKEKQPSLNQKKEQHMIYF